MCHLDDTFERSGDLYIAFKDESPPVGLSPVRYLFYCYSMLFILCSLWLLASFSKRCSGVDGSANYELLRYPCCDLGRTWGKIRFRGRGVVCKGVHGVYWSMYKWAGCGIWNGAESLYLCRIPLENAPGIAMQWHLCPIRTYFCSNVQFQGQGAHACRQHRCQIILPVQCHQSQ